MKEPAREEAATHDPWRGRSIALASLTAVLTVAVATAAFLSAQAASASGDSYATSTLALADANFFYEQGVRAFIEDLEAGGEAVDRDCVLSLFADGIDEFCEGDLEEIQALADEDPVLIVGDRNQAIADAEFEVGLAKSNEAVEYQSGLVILAVGLALSAWASLSERSHRVSLIFAGISVVALVAGVAQIATV